MRLSSNYRAAIWLLAVFQLICCTFASAQAPQSIEGMIFHPAPYIRADRVGIFSVTAFQPGGIYSHMIWASGSALDSSEGVVWKLGYNQPANGTYVYQRIDDVHAEILEIDPTGKPERFDLTFDSAKSGTFDTFPSGNASAGTSFKLVDPVEFQSLPLINTSVRGVVAPGKFLIAGVIIPAGSPRELLIRAIGPGLKAYGVGSPMDDPDFQLYSGTKPVIHLASVHRSNWSADQAGVPTGATATAFEALFRYVGAVPLAEGSKDAVEIVSLPPGAYTILCNSENNASGGDVLLETYVIP